MKIGIIGSGKIGGTVGTLWAKAGHHVLFASRNPGSLAELVRLAGPAVARAVHGDEHPFRSYLPQGLHGAAQLVRAVKSEQQHWHGHGTK